MEKINLKDCTLVVPVRFDSNDRVNNVKLMIKYINTYFDTNIFICEHDTVSIFEENFKEVNLLNVSHYFIQSDDELFYKTKCINDTVKNIKTPYFSIYDADILLKPEQIIETINLLRTNVFETVYPYDGTFLNVPKYFYNNIYNNCDLRVIDISVCSKGLGMPELTPDRQSFGGCVFFNTESFKRYGMANEYIISYGPEDCEIAFRFRLLSKFSRVNGPLYHMDHIRKLNSNEDHKMVSNNHAEFRKVLNMTKDELLAYVQTWKWL